MHKSEHASIRLTRFETFKYRVSFIFRTGKGDPGYLPIPGIILKKTREDFIDIGHMAPISVLFIYRQKSRKVDAESFITQKKLHGPVFLPAIP
jgi:hypothetical protein